MQRAHYLSIAVVLLGLSLGACAIVAPPSEITSPEMAMAYGHIEADMVIDQVDIHEYGETYLPPFRYPPRVLIYDNGTFMVENLKPGKYVIAAYHSGPKIYNLVNDERTAYQRIFIIKPGELAFLGSFRLTINKKSLIGKGDFDIDEMQRPTERDLLKQIFEKTQGTGWQKKIERRLKELRQN